MANLRPFDLFGAGVLGRCGEGVCGDPGLAVRNTRLWFTQRSQDQSVVAHNPN